MTSPAILSEEPHGFLSPGRYLLSVAADPLNITFSASRTVVKFVHV